MHLIIIDFSLVHDANIGDRRQLLIESNKTDSNRVDDGSFKRRRTTNLDDGQFLKMKKLFDPACNNMKLQTIIADVSDDIVVIYLITNNL